MEGGHLDLLHLATSGDVEGVKMMLKNPFIDPVTCEYALMWAANNGHAEIVRMFLADSRFDPTTYDNNPIRHPITVVLR